MDTESELTQRLYKGGHISGGQLEEIKTFRALKIFSLNLELRGLLYAGILGITSGAGILVYKNIDSIGHTAILTFIGLACVSCFAWSFRNAPGFKKEQVISANPLFDYVVLAACLLAGIFIAYIQYQYVVFGDHYGLATLVPTLLYFFSAYYFDQRGVLALAITGLGAWLGITVAPSGFFYNSFEFDAVFDFTGLGLGTALILYTIYAEREALKVHFNFTYLNFAMHLLFISSLTGLFTQAYWPVFIIPIAATAWYFLLKARQMNSFNFLLFTVLYCYIAFTHVFSEVFRFLPQGEFFLLLIPLYYFISLGVTIKWLLKFRKKLRS